MARDKGDRRDEILATAARLFAASGFHGVSVDDLGAELGISGPAIYRYFRGKEAILGEMLVEVSTRLLDGARAGIAAHDDPADQLDALIAGHAEFAMTEPELIAVQFRDLGNAADLDRRRVRSLQRQYVGLWVDVLEQVHPGVPEPRALTGVQAVFGLLNSTPHSGRHGDAGAQRVLRRMAVAALAEACAPPYDVNGR